MEQRKERSWSTYNVATFIPFLVKCFDMLSSLSQWSIPIQRIKSRRHKFMKTVELRIKTRWFLFACVSWAEKENV